jgi:CO/xanthine dehydrogenase Mo-binding subunit/aerobic-type carbon monoxide dehydrogenase small subunit (CoxS/CutS family)
MLRFSVNGREIQYEPREETRKCLLDFLRDDLRLTGAKRGCEEKGCGACTVLIDGEAKRSCAVYVEDMQGKSIVTIEGLAKDGKLDPVQEAFIEYSAVQCGFCTPGLIMAVHGLLNKNPNPSEDEIKKGLRLNLCRCGAYPRVILAVKKAAAVLRGEEVPPYVPLDISKPGSFIGKSIPRRDLPDKVTGKTKFYADYYFDNMLFGKAVYSPYPHALVLAVDTAPAYAVPGVQLVITAKDIPGRNLFGVLAQDQPVLCDKRVKYIGDMVAVVFADDEEAAEKGAAAVKVEYQELPGVFTVEDALKEGAPLIPSAEREPYWNAYIAAEKGNICKEVTLHRGNVEKAFAQSDVVIEEQYTTKPEEHAWIEVDGALAAYDEEHVLTIYAPNQSPFADRDQLPSVLGLKAEEIRIVHLSAGGAFGGKTELTAHALVAIAVMKTGRPAKMVLKRKDSLRTHPKRHPYYMTYKIGAKKDGKILAMQVHIVADAGAYTSWTPRVLEQGISYCTGPYYIPNLDLKGTGVYTNNLISGAMRGFGAIQSHFGAECSLDSLSRKLGIDPVTLREINGLERGLPMTTGQILTDKSGIDYKNTLKAVKKVISEKLLPLKKPGEYIGIGVASGWRSVAGGLGPDENAGAAFELAPDGRVSYRIACTEMGQGSHTALAQMASEVTGVAWDDYDIVAGDTSRVPYGGGVMASRGVFLWGHPTIAAGKKFRELLLNKSAEILQMAAGELTLQNSKILEKESGEQKLTLAQLAARSRERLIAEVDFILPKTCPVLPNANEDRAIDPLEYKPHHTVAYNTTAVVVRINPSTGAVELLNVTEVCDGGQIINPEAAATQIEGAIIMGSAYGLTNNFKIVNGINATNSLGKCKIPRFENIAQTMDVVFCEAYDPAGPFGSKGVAEIGVLTPAPAICNAIYDAVGVRIHDLPAAEHIKEIKDALEKLK